MPFSGRRGSDSGPPACDDHASRGDVDAWARRRDRGGGKGATVNQRLRDNPRRTRFLLLTTGCGHLNAPLKAAHQVAHTR
jgi:hypothetical protein